LEKRKENIMTNQRFTNRLNESIYTKIGSTWFLDGTFVYLISPMGFIGFFLNIICLLIYFKIKIKLKSENLVKYLRIYSLVSSFICLIIGFTFIAFSPRYFFDLFEKYATYFKCKIFDYLLVCLYQYGISIDFLIVIETISHHSNKLMLMRNINPYLCSSINLLLCLIVNYPLTNFDRLILISNIELDVKNCQKLFKIIENRQIEYLIATLQNGILALILMLAIFMTHYFNDVISNKSSSINSIGMNENDKRLLILSQKLCSNTFICHLIILIIRYLFIVFLLRVNQMVSYVYVICITCFIISFKNSLNIIIFYLYDSRFKENFINFNRRNYVAKYF
jgi:hypothetical protein